VLLRDLFCYIVTLTQVLPEVRARLASGGPRLASGGVIFMARSRWPLQTANSERLQAPDLGPGGLTSAHPPRYRGSFVWIGRRSGS
jgi:hypothetical protein